MNKLTKLALLTLATGAMLVACDSAVGGNPSDNLTNGGNNGGDNNGGNNNGNGGQVRETKTALGPWGEVTWYTDVPKCENLECLNAAARDMGEIYHAAFDKCNELEHFGIAQGKHNDEAQKKYVEGIWGMALAKHDGNALEVAMHESASDATSYHAGVKIWPCTPDANDRNKIKGETIEFINSRSE